MTKRLLILLLLLCSSVLGQVPYQKPMMGQQIDWSNPLSKGLVGYWLMNEGTGNVVADLSGNGNTGTLVADTHWVPGKFGPCLSLDGDGDWVNTKEQVTSIGVGKSFTVSMFVNTVNAGATGTLLSSNSSTSDRFSIEINSVGAAVAGLYNGAGYIQNVRSGAGSIVSNRLYHIVYTTDTVNAFMYVDAIASNTSQNPTTALNAGTRIGARVSGLSPFNGTIDDVMIYNRALTPGEITELYINPFGMFRPTFSVWWYSGIGGEPPATFGQVIMISN